MSVSNGIIECEPCSRLTASDSYQCPHCLVSFCRQCLIQHQHNAVKWEFIDLTKQIDEILQRFLYHAHNQTEWTDHLTKDRNRLQEYIQFIENYYKGLPILALPNLQWVNHVKNLISKHFFDIHQDCCKLMYPYSNSFIKSS